MTKLSDTQLILLSAAAQRDNLSLYPLAKEGPGLAKAVAALATRGLVEERETSAAGAAHRHDGDLAYGLFVTAAGLEALGIEPRGEEEAGGVAGSAAVTPAAPRTTKAGLVLGLLGHADGATVAELMAVTGWLPHTTRAALTGLRKKGHVIVKDKRDGATCYKVMAA